jgi:hypothetical protein
MPSTRSVVPPGLYALGVRPGEIDFFPWEVEGDFDENRPRLPLPVTAGDGEATGLESA